MFSYFLFWHHRWRICSSVSEIIQADIYRHRVVEHISPFSAFILPSDHIHGNPFAVVAHKEMCEDLLSDELFLAGAEVDQPQGIFQFPERTFDAPSEPVQFLDIPYRKPEAVKARAYRIIVVFASVIGNFQSDHPDGQIEQAFEIPRFLLVNLALRAVFLKFKTLLTNMSEEQQQKMFQILKLISEI